MEGYRLRSADDTFSKCLCSERARSLPNSDEMKTNFENANKQTLALVRVPYARSGKKHSTGGNGEFSPGSASGQERGIGRVMPLQFLASLLHYSQKLKEICCCVG